MKEVERMSHRAEILEKQKECPFPSIITWYSEPLVVRGGGHFGIASHIAPPLTCALSDVGNAVRLLDQSSSQLA
jgi:hypothetical protein